MLDVLNEAGLDVEVAACANENDLIKCPKCDSRMIRMVDAKQSHIWFEHCGSCFGHFFDAGELKDLKKNTVMDFIKSWFTPERKP